MAENDADKLHIRLHVYDEEIDIKVARSEEHLYRAAAKLITDKYNAYAQAYKGHKSDHTIALMTLVDIALQKETLGERNDTAPYVDILKSLTAEIEETLSETNKQNINS